MSRVITFSRQFPGYHPKNGMPTHFVEKALNSFLMGGYNIYPKKDIPVDFLKSLSKEIFHPKHHTIRAGHRFKAGDMFSPRVWSGRPYHTKQIIFADDVEVKKVFDFTMTMLKAVRK